MLLKWREDAQVALHSSGVVILNVACDHLGKFLLAGKTPAVIALSFQNAPEAFHRAVINAVGNTGHTLRHSSLYELVMEYPAGVLVSSVAMEQGMCVWIGSNCLVKGFENQWIVVALTKHIGHDASVTEVQNGAQVELMDFGSLIPLEFCYIGEPLLVGLCSIELPVQKIISKILRILRLSGTSTVAVFHGRAYISGSADSEHPLVIDTNVIVMTQVVIEPPVAFIRAFLMDFFKLVCQTFILYGSSAQLAGIPLVVSGSSHMEQLTGQLDGITIFLVCFPNRGIDAALSYFR